jgi:peptidoglycan/xylan/chitin deacetylase (PgdA/CDA1 family)
MLQKEGKGTTQKTTTTDFAVTEIEKLNGAFPFKLEKSIAMLKKMHPNKIDKLLDSLEGRWGSNQKITNRAFLSWEEVREMRISGLISYGSHTASHPILTTLSVDEINEELRQSKKKLISENAVEKSFIPFCYPNGNYNVQIIKMVKDAGYSLAVTTMNGWNNIQTDPFVLKRIGLHNDISSTMAMFACKIVK